MVTLFNACIRFAEKLLAPITMLVARIYVAKIFWDSGVLKFEDWETTIYLFREEFKLPIISPETAATLAVYMEVGLPVLLVVGLASRMAAGGLFVMTLVIEFLVDSSPHHHFWMIILALIVTHGPNVLSLDYFFRKKWGNCP